MTDTYQSPTLIPENLAARDGVTITTPNATVSGRGVERLVDGRPGIPLEFATSESDHRIDVDLGNLYAGSAALVLFDPSLVGVTIGALRGTASPPTASIGSGVMVNAPVFLSGASAASRYWRITFTGTGAFKVPQVYIGKHRVLARGLAHNWRADVDDQVDLDEDLAGFEASLVRGPARRIFDVRSEAVTEALDLEAWRGVQQLARAQSIAFLPPDDTWGWGLYKALEEVSLEQVRANPAAGIAYTVEARLAEQL